MEYARENLSRRGKLSSRCIGRIPAGSEVFVKTIQGPHVLVGDFKIEDIGVFTNAVGVSRLGDDHQIVLDRPADQDLRC